MKLVNLIPAKYRTLAIILATLAVVGAFFGYVAWEKHKTKEETTQAVETKHTVETLKEEKAYTETKIEVRKKQNAAIVEDITPGAFDSVYANGSF